jgi:hypothetical protein
LMTATWAPNVLGVANRLAQADREAPAPTLLPSLKREALERSGAGALRWGCSIIALAVERDQTDGH